MKLQGTIANFSFSYNTRKPCITIEVDSVPDDLTQVGDSPLDIDIRKHSKKRSLNANAYAWVLMTNLASRLNTTKEEIYEQMLEQCGIFDSANGEYIVVMLKDGIPKEALPGHWMDGGSNGRFTTYIKLKGSSEYDSSEMSILLDRIIQGCKEVGIETLTPDEIERMVQVWKK